MATDFYSLFSAAPDPYAERQQQQQLFQQNLSRATTPQQFIATVGSNLGGQLGGAATDAASSMFGLKSEAQKQKEALNQAMLAEKDITDPVQRLKNVSARLRNLGMSEAAMRVEMQASEIEKTELSKAATRAGTAQTVQETKFAAEKQPWLIKDLRQNIEHAAAMNPMLQIKAAQGLTIGALDIEATRQNIESAKWKLENDKKIAPLEKQKLEQQIEKATLEIEKDKALQPYLIKEAQYKVGALMRDENLRNALSDLPENASNEQVMATIRRNGGDPKIVLDAIVRTQIADENNKSRLEAVKAREETKRQINQQKLAQMPKDAAEKLAETVLLENSNDKIDGFIQLLDENKVDFSIGGQASSWVKSMFGKPSQKELDAANIRSAIKQQANSILQAAKGTQTEGDAKRALEIITNQLEKNSNAGIKNALQRLKETQTKVIAGNRVYMRARHSVSDDLYNEATGKTTGDRPPLSSFNK